MIRWHFMHGPLDGLRTECDSEETSDCPLNLAAHAYRESLNGFPGATFDAFSPPELAGAGSVESTQRLHAYRVDATQQYLVPVGNSLAPVLNEIRAKYVGATDRVIAYRVDRQAGSMAVKVRRQWSPVAPPQFPGTP